MSSLDVSSELFCSQARQERRISFTRREGGLCDERSKPVNYTDILVNGIKHGANACLNAMAFSSSWWAPPRRREQRLPSFAHFHAQRLGDPGVFGDAPRPRHATRPSCGPAVGS